MFDHVADMARKRADISPEAIAFREGPDGPVWRFDQVDLAANAIAAGLLEQGFTAGDRLAILCLNSIEFFLTLFACQKTGIILCPLNWRQPAPELIDTMAPVGARGVIFDDANADTGRELAQALSANEIDFAQLRHWIDAGGQVSDRDIPAGDPWYLLFTSGTTGRAKAVIQTPRMAWANATGLSLLRFGRGSDEFEHECILPSGAFQLSSH